MPRTTMHRPSPSLVILAAFVPALGTAPPAPALAQTAARTSATGDGSARGWIGINLEANELHGPEGRIDSRLVIRGVVDGSPADRAQIRPGDVILRLNGRPASFEAFVGLASGLRPGNRFDVTLARRGPEWEGWERRVTLEAEAKPAPAMVALPGEWVDRMDSAIQRLDSLRVRIAHSEGAGGAVLLHNADSPFPVAGTGRIRAVGPDSTRTLVFYSTDPDRTTWSMTLGPRGEGSGVEPTGSVVDTMARTFRPLMPYIEGRNRVAGAELTPLNPQLSTYFQRGHEVGHGLLVTAVSDGTPAADAGLVPGDVVVRVGGVEVTSLADLRSALSRPAAGALTLEVVRRGQSLRVTLPR